MKNSGSFKTKFLIKAVKKESDNISSERENEEIKKVFFNEACS